MHSLCLPCYHTVYISSAWKQWKEAVLIAQQHVLNLREQQWMSDQISLFHQDIPVHEILCHIAERRLLTLTHTREFQLPVHHAYKIREALHPLLLQLQNKADPIFQISLQFHLL